MLQKWTSVQFLDNADFFREENHLFHNLSLLYVRMMLTQNAKKIDDNKKMQYMYMLQNFNYCDIFYFQ